MKKLVRVKQGSKLFGVCQGIAEYMNIDPTVIRLVAIFLALFSFGTAFVGYLIAGFVMPEDDGYTNI